MKQPQREQRRIVYAVAGLVCAAILFTLFFSAYARRFDRMLMEENRSRLEEVSGHVAAYIERAVAQQWEELRVVAEASSTISDEAQRVAYLGRMAETLDFAYIGLADTGGTLYASALQAPEDISQEDYFQAARNGRSFMTGLRLQIFWDRAVSGIILAMPVPAEQDRVIVAMLSLEKLGSDIQVESFDGNGFSYIIDAEGEQVLHAKSVAYNNLFQVLDNLEFERGYSLSAMRENIAAGQAGMTAYSDLGMEKYAYYRPLSFNGCTVVSIVPKGVVTARTSTLSRELILGCVAAMVVFLGLLSVMGMLLLRLESRRRANRAKSDFLANMSHDMRTPMNAIMGMTAIAEAHADEPDTVRDCMRKISFSSAHLLGLINDVLDMSRIESGKMTLAREPFSLAELLESMENMTFPRILAKGQHFALRLHNVTSERFLGDSLRLNQSFVNILTNSIKFTPEDGRITVDVEELPQEAPDTAQFRFTFTDSGIGMKPAFLKDLFTPFLRERNSRVDSTEGSGLGMSITKRIVDLMGGAIEVQSTEGIGTTFTLTLPLSLDHAAPGELPPPRWHVLLVGSHDDELADATHTLTAMGLSAAWTDSVEDAARRLSAQPCQAIFLCRGTYSSEAVALLREKSGNDPAFLLVAYNWEDIQKEAAQAGVSTFVQKPLLRSTLCHALRKAARLDVVKDTPPLPDGGLSGKRILLVEDNELNLEIAQALLEGAGATVFSAADGAAGVAAFKASSPGGIDLILMDIQMPRMDGYEATRHIRASTRPDASLPILAMSANAYAEDIAAAARAGMDGYLTKPIDLTLWMTEIRKALGINS